MGGERLALEDFAGLDASGANANALANAVHNGFDRLQIRIPATARDIVRVRDVVAELWTFAADFTYLCHDKLSVKQTFVLFVAMSVKRPDSGNGTRKIR